MSDAATDPSAALLESILQTLQQINEKLSIQEQSRDRPGEGQESSPTLPSRLSERRTASTPLSPLSKTHFANELDRGDSIAIQRLQRLPSHERSNYDLGAPLVAPLETDEDDNSTSDYRSWSSRLEDSPLRHHSFVAEELGGAWTIPDDGRLPLSFSREVLEGLSPDQLRITVSYISKFRDRMARSDALRFYVIDYDTLGRHVVYRLGEPTVIGWQQWKPPSKINPTDDAPWQRFLLCQGLNTAQKADVDSAGRAGCVDEAPFLLHNDRCNTRNYLTSAIQNHLGFWQPSQSLTNPFNTYWEAFHITFYEAASVETPKVTRDLRRGQWRHGSLYGSDDMDFYESALTLIAIPAKSHRPHRPPGNELEAIGRQHERIIMKDYACREWSILMLAPLGFFDTSYHQFPLKKYSFMASIGGRSMEGATVTLLEATYNRLRYNWKLFRKHFQGLLDQGDEEIALFKPALHDDLLQDDEGFSRSRRYAWVIKCLTNFERSISENILQWRRFRSARLDHLHMSALSRTSINKIEMYCTELEAVHQYFSMKLASTRAVQDGLLNASAVTESRESTRLAKNIRLLTYVSIFFQPLAFCTSLWSINNNFSSTALIYTSLVVGLLTYIIIFHLNNLVYQTSSAYNPIRDAIIARMKKDSRAHWASKGKRFATFQAKPETLKPSEWWVLIFGVQSMFQSLRRRRFYKQKPANADTEASPAPTVVSDGNEASSKAAETISDTTEELSAIVTASSTSNDSNQPLNSESPADDDSQQPSLSDRSFEKV